MTVKSIVNQFETAVGSVISGKPEIIRLSALTILCQGHMLIEDIPGTGKTTLAKAAASALDCRFGRIQFTPDLLPSDITGINIFSRKTEEFTFRKGPVFTNILLADEINRAAPRTQSALLECMEEKQITCDGVTMKLPEPFSVIATQNPLETAGTYPLPEAQLDRFFISTTIGYPDRNSEADIISGKSGVSALDSIQSVVSAEEICRSSEEINSVKTADCIIGYILDIAQITRSSSDFYAGMSTRCAADLVKASKAQAAAEGRDFVIPDDVKYLLPHIAAHRIIPENPLARSIDARKQLIISAAERVPVPKEELWKY
jgi:MoxR-like ATPase